MEKLAHRIMVVTEYPALRAILVGVLEGRLLQVFPAADGVDALRQIYHVSPHVVIADTELSNCAGFELLPFLRRRFPEIGVISLVRGTVPRKEQMEAIISDDIVSMDPIDRALFEQSVVDVCVNYPFRQEGEAVDRESSRSGESPSDETMQLAPYRNG